MIRRSDFLAIKVLIIDQRLFRQVTDAVVFLRSLSTRDRLRTVMIFFFFFCVARYRLDAFFIYFTRRKRYDC